MDSKSLLDTRSARIEAVIDSWADKASTAFPYSMAQIVKVLFHADFGTVEFWRIAPLAGEFLRKNGFVQITRKNKRMWVKRTRLSITLPLSRDMNRCKGQGPLVGETCSRRDNCARYLSIFADERPLPAYYGICTGPIWHGYVPMEGYPDWEAAPI